MLTITSYISCAVYSACHCSIFLSGHMKLHDCSFARLFQISMRSHQVKRCGPFESCSNLDQFTLHTTSLLSCPYDAILFHLPSSCAYLTTHSHPFFPSFLFISSTLHSDIQQFLRPDSNHHSTQRKRLKPLSCPVQTHQSQSAAMPSKWTPDDEFKLLLVVIKESQYKPKWDIIQAAMGPKFTAEGIRYVSSATSPSFLPQGGTSPPPESARS